MNLFLQHGLPLSIGFRDMYPPTMSCLNPACLVYDPLTGHQTGRRLSGTESTHRATLFSHDHGAIPIWTTSWECLGCFTRYHPNYYVPSEQPRLRHYYGGIPEYIHISDEFFVSSQLCESITNEMVCAWVSSTNNARIYNLSHPTPPMSMSWSISLDLDPGHVWDAFFFHSLLLQCDESTPPTALVLADNAPSQADRLRPALEDRNRLMVGPGQEYWNHACQLCCDITHHEDGSLTHIRSVVTDGITMGHPSCGSHNCQNPLPNMRARFCVAHAGLESLCAARDNGVPCARPCEQGRRTCALAAHRKLEDGYVAQGRAMFQLRRRLEKLKVSQTNSALPATIDYADVCEGKPESGNRQLRAKFGRSRTHNEELCVASCGVILGRATFFGSEAPTSVIDFWKMLFPTKQSLPSVIWHDNNCSVMKILKRTEDDYFEDTALPVDVFHFKCKHKESDVFCGEHCNPAKWPQLMRDGRWRFNSSAAEQTNAWMGGFRAIVREMRPDRYNFFLDEMIKRRNRIVVENLERKGHNPWQMDREGLLL
ncbi:hypothetical protein EXIGLDRAFT_820929 [Exidia glandulosa HHB12029]|uniref:CxC6 like cysteine cluster associated with KDZ domain-containing protein n=1 Tax=Exidia glandulosa HHB12029 TaxID=1314781 RepID=A0A166NH41_EXIGL|nr:hypothetical protein EXIGLDRAFT_820929 [Exidia glandulosa HHB12029]